MKAGMMVLSMLLMSGCSLNLKHEQVNDAPVGGYQTQHHTITFNTEPACVGSCKIAANQ